MVSHPSSLYITDEYIVTHNTALGLQIAADQSRNYPVGIFSLEMATESLMRRRVSSYWNTIGHYEKWYAYKSESVKYSKCNG